MTAEADRQRALTEGRQRALTESESRLRTVLDATGVGTFMWHVATDRAEPDRRLLELFGLPADGSISLAGATGHLLHPDDRDRYGVAVGAALDAAGSGIFRQEIRVVLPDGSLRWLEINAKVEPSAGDDGGPLMIGVASDITDRKAAEAQRDELTAREHQGRESAEVFMAVLSHELRTPVTGIFGTAALLLRDPGRPDLRQLLTDMEEDAERLLRIVDDLMVLFGVGRGVVSLTLEPLLVQRVLSRVLVRLGRRFPSVRFDIDAPQEVPTVLADNAALGQVLTNILANAANYAGADGPIRVGLEVHGKFVEVSVTDHGPGLGPDPERLFTLFYRSPHTASVASGTGIGLYVVRELVRAMGGTIRAGDAEGGGAVIGFTLPVIDEHEALDPWVDPNVMPSDTAIDPSVMPSDVAH